MYESLGPKRFPDFSIGENIAVEATRLVKTVSTPGGEIALETVEPRIIQTLKNAIESVNPGGHEGSCFVSLKLSLDVDPRHAAKALRGRLKREPPHSIGSIHICPGLTVELDRAHKSYETPFRLGAISITGSASWLIDDLRSQCLDAIRRKEPKIEACTHDYAEYWLAVGGGLTTGLSDFDFSDFAECFQSETHFGTLLLIDCALPHLSRKLKLNRLQKAL